MVYSIQDLLWREQTCGAHEALTYRMLRKDFCILVQSEELTVKPAIVVDHILESVQQLKSSAFSRAIRIKYLIETEEAVRVDK